MDLVFPPRCASCDRLGEWLCDPCAAQMRRLPQPICRQCGLPARPPLCWRCRGSRSSLDGIRAFGYLEGTLRAAVHGLKYRGRRGSADALAGLLVQVLSREPLPHDLIVPVPLHSDRKGERGFNQAELLADALALSTGRPVGREALFRVRDTLPQVRLGIAERRRNVRGAFRASARAVAGRMVLLVDDVATTGATLEACARALRADGAASVWGLVLARER
ncbi:MAG: ComF family protein [Anaerolineae bacterium]